MEQRLDGWMVELVSESIFGNLVFLNIIPLILLQGFVNAGETVVLSKGIED